MRKFADLFVISGLILLSLGIFSIVEPTLNREVNNDSADRVAAANTEQPIRIIIPEIGVNAPLVYPTETKEEVFQKFLENGVAHFPGTALPGEVGNAYYFGHSSDYSYKNGNYKEVFSRLPRLNIGDSIYFEYSNSSKIEYKIIQAKIVKPTDLSVLSQETQNEKLLTLQTSYPIGFSYERYLVIGKL